MSDLVSVADVREWAPTLSDAEVADLAAEANAAITHYAPCVVGGAEHLAVLARAAIRRIIQAEEALLGDEDAPPEYLKDQQIGPYRYGYDTERRRLLLSESDAATLRALCTPRGVGGVRPLGNFPAPLHLDGLFAERPR